MTRGGLTHRALGSARVAVQAIGRRVPFVLGAARSAVASVRRSRYRRIARSVDVNPRSALFKAYSGRSYACGPRAIYEAVLADPAFDDFELVWVFREPLARALAARGFTVRGLPDESAGADASAKASAGGSSASGAIDLDVALGPQALDRLSRATIVVWGTAEHDRAHARTAYWFCNTVIPWHIDPGPEQAYIQLWHGTPLKRLGRDIDPSRARNALYSGRQTHRRYTWEGTRFTYLVTASAFSSEKLSSAFGLSEAQRAEKVLELGHSRNDMLFSAGSSGEAAAIKARLGIPAGKRVVLYAPTWRDDQHSAGKGYTLQMPIDFDALHRELGDDHVVLFRPHYLIANEFDFARHGGFVRDASAVSDVNELCLISDVLVTDYSSVFFDYANLKRPIIFYMYDFETYANNMRGFYVDVDDLPGPIVRTQDELVAALRSAPDTTDVFAERYRRFNERFTYLDDGRASERVVGRVVSR